MLVVNVHDGFGIARLEFYSQVPPMPEPIGPDTPEGVLQQDSQTRQFAVRTTCIVPLVAIPHIQKVVNSIMEDSED